MWVRKMPRVNYCGVTLDGLVLLIKSSAYAAHGGLGPASAHIRGMSKTRLYERMKRPEELTVSELREIRKGTKMNKDELLEQLKKVL